MSVGDDNISCSSIRLLVPSERVAASMPRLGFFVFMFGAQTFLPLVIHM